VFSDMVVLVVLVQTLERERESSEQRGIEAAAIFTCLNSRATSRGKANVKPRSHKPQGERKRTTARANTQRYLPRQCSDLPVARIWSTIST
jgi:hypothetical protein